MRALLDSARSRSPERVPGHSVAPGHPVSHEPSAECAAACWRSYRGKGKSLLGLLFFLTHPGSGARFSAPAERMREGTPVPADREEGG